MKKILFDTYVVSLMLSGNLPEKWVRYANEIRKGERILLMFEPLISEIFYKNVPVFGISKCRDKIYWLKSLPKVEIHTLTDNDALDAGEIKVQQLQYGLSLVDCYLLSIGKRRNSIVLTTDHGVRDVGKKIGVEVKYCLFTNTDER